MCHSIPITERIALDRETIPLAELLLTKLQVVELNEKDQRDILALFSCRDIGDNDAGVINGTYVAELLAADWGLWRTTKLNLERVADAIAGYDLSDADEGRIGDRIVRLQQRIEAEPKSRGWRLRDRVGDRKRWYEEPEEVG